MIDIKEDLKGSELSRKLIELRVKDKKNNLLEILYKLKSNDNLLALEFPNHEITPKEIRNIDILEHTDNIELLARWYDLLQQLRINVKENAPLAYQHYMKTYNESGRWCYALRAFLIVKSKKGLFKDKQTEISRNYELVLSNLPLNYSGPYKKILSSFRCFIDEINTTSIESNIKSRLQRSLNKQDYNSAITYLDCLKTTGKIDDTSYKKKKSNLFEQEADNIVANKEPNTFYPEIFDTYKKALTEISSFKDCQEDEKRILKKMRNEVKEDIKAMWILGLNLKPKNNCSTRFEEYILENKKKPMLVFKKLIKFPIISVESVNYIVINSKNNHSFLYEKFNQQEQINQKGATTSIKKGDNAIEDHIRRLGQEVIIDSFINPIKEMSSFNECKIDTNYILEHLKKLNSKFIPQDRLQPYAQALYFGFKGDFALASTALLPQMENSFRYIAEQLEIQTTQFTKDIQNENTMGGVLLKLKESTNKDVWAELNHFLIDGTNFRNEAMHGLCSYENCHYYGSYLWWLCLKIIYHTDEYFFNTKK